MYRKKRWLLRSLKRKILREIRGHKSGMKQKKEKKLITTAEKKEKQIDTACDETKCIFKVKPKFVMIPLLSRWVITS